MSIINRFPSGSAGGGGGGSAITINDTLDEHGGTVRTITAVNLSGDTTNAAVTLQGYTGHDADGNPFVGTYVPSGSSTLITKTITVNGTYRASDDNADGFSQVTVNVPQPTSVTQATPTITVNASGLITASATQTAGYVAAGTKSATEQLSTQAGTTITPTESEQTAVAAGKFTTGAVKVGAISPTYVGSGITQRSSSDLSASGGTITAPAGYYESAASKSVAAMTLPTAVASTSSGTSKATIGRSTSDQYINIPVGYNGTAAYYKISAVPNGTAGTPTATKSAVNNHALTVTPSVTNTAGYINGGTINGTAVTVSASELVSGSQTITVNDTYDVTNLQTIVVNVAGSGANIQTSKAYTVSASGTADITPDQGYDAMEKVELTVPSTTAATPQIELISSTSTIRAFTTQTAGYVDYAQKSATYALTRLTFTTITPGTSNQTILDNGAVGHAALGAIVVQGSSSLVSGNIRSGSTIFGVSGSQYVVNTQETTSPMSAADLASGKIGWVNGEKITGTNSGGGESKNAQTAQSTTRATTTSYTECISLTCTKAGTYDVYWSTFRSSTSGTWGSQLYLDDTAYGSAQTGSWSNHIQNIHLSNVTIAANAEVAIRVRSRGSSYYGYVGTLTIIEA